MAEYSVTGSTDQTQQTTVDILTKKIENRPNIIEADGKVPLPSASIPYKEIQLWG